MSASGVAIAIGAGRPTKSQKELSLSTFLLQKKPSTIQPKPSLKGSRLWHNFTTGPKGPWLSSKTQICSPSATIERVGQKTSSPKNLARPGYVQFTRLALSTVHSKAKNKPNEGTVTNRKHRTKRVLSSTCSSNSAEKPSRT